MRKTIVSIAIGLFAVAYVLFNVHVLDRVGDDIEEIPKELVQWDEEIEDGLWDIGPEPVDINPMAREIPEIQSLTDCMTDENEQPVNCIWWASSRGNGMGESFIAYDGFLRYNLKW